MPIRLAHLRRSGLLWSIFGLVACGGSGDGRPTAPTTPPAAAIRFDSGSVNLTVGANRQLVAIVTDASGAALAAGGQDIRWNSINPAVVSVSQTGVVHGIAPGSALVTAVIGSHVAIETVTVLAPLSSRRLRFAIDVN